MDVRESLELLGKKAREDEKLRQELLATRGEKNKVSAFCAIAEKAGVPIDAMDLVLTGEQDYAAMRRSTNGGGENAPLLQGEDDLYEMFLVELE